MLFNSYIFWLFFVAVLALVALVRRREPQNFLLLVASYVFYGAWDWRFLSLIFISTLVDYVSGRAIGATEDGKRRKLFLTWSMVTNLGLLGAFKYYGFFARELSVLLDAIGLGVSLPVLELVLPVGISFYTFQTMSYTIDVYRGEVKPSKSLLDFALFVCFFPQLVAGPIERYNRLMPQIAAPRTVDSRAVSEGIYHILLGLFKKVVIADNMARLTNAVFLADPTALTGPEVLMGLLAFTFQIYGDFSGYSSIAQGTARLLGFDLMYNFRMPYFASSPSDFWRRWHISLSQWLRDYLYISLGGSRKGGWQTYRNLMLTMLLGGLWHGAGWTFVAWGAFHGAILWVYRPFESRRKPAESDRAGLAVRLAHIGAVAVMFCLTMFGWLLFRSQSIGQVGAMLVQMVTAPTVTPLAVHGLLTICYFVLPLMVYELWVESRKDMLALLSVHWLPRALVYAGLVWMLWFFPAETVHEFIYFQF